MQPKEKISRAAYSIIEAAKDSAQSDITNAIRAGQIKVEAKSVPALLSLMAASIESGYHRAARTFDRTIESCLEEVRKETAAFPPMAPTKKK